MLDSTSYSHRLKVYIPWQIFNVWSAQATSREVSQERGEEEKTFIDELQQCPSRALECRAGQTLEKSTVTALKMTRFWKLDNVTVVSLEHRVFEHV